MLLKEYPKKFSIKNNIVHFLESYTPVRVGVQLSQKRVQTPTIAFASCEGFSSKSPWTRRYSRPLIRRSQMEDSTDLSTMEPIMGLKVEDFLERRLQTQVFKLGLAKSIHHARVLIRQRHIRVRKQVMTRYEP